MHRMALPPPNGGASASDGPLTTLHLTQPTAEPVAEPEPEHGSIRRLALVSLLALVLLSALGAVAGTLIGSRERAEQRQEAVARVTLEQFQRGLADLDAARFELARQRFEYIIRLDPAYPDAPEMLARALLALNSPTSSPTLLETSTPDLAPAQELFDRAKTAFEAQEWTQVVDWLLALRAKSPSFQAIEADGMMYVALHNRGIARISTEGGLEEGLYDLALAERFGPLDRDAGNWRDWAQLYLLANSYYGADWAQATYYFGQVYLVAPYLKGDAYQKFARSSRNYADELVKKGDPCAAQAHFQQSLLIEDDPELAPTATEAANLCLTATAFPTSEPTDITPTPGASPTPEPTATETPTPG